MDEGKFYQFDVVVFIDLHEIPSLIDIGIKEGTEYFISDVFEDGRCIIYKESLDQSNPTIPVVNEYMLTSSEMDYAIFLYNVLAEQQSMDMYSKGESVEQVMEVLMSSFDMIEGEAYYTDEFTSYSSHEFKVGDIVYFDDVSKIDGYKEARLEVGELYEIVELDKYTNAPVIKCQIGDFGIFPNEVKYMNKHNDKRNNSNDDLNGFVDKLLKGNHETLIDLSIDQALEDKNFEKVQDIYNTYKK